MTDSAARSAQRPHGGRWRTILVVAGAVVLLDAVTKALAAHYLAGRGPVHVAGDVRLLLYRNFAGPGGSLAGHSVLVSLLVAAAIVLILVVARQVRTTTAAVAIGLVLGGGIGNLADRLLRAPGPLRGGVVDWLKPTATSGSMNLADLALNAALIVMVVGTAFTWLRSRARGSSPEAPPPAVTAPSSSPR